MTWILRLKHWLLFLLLFIPFISIHYTIDHSLRSVTDWIMWSWSVKLSTGAMAGLIQLIWFYSMGVNLTPRLPEGVKLNIKAFKAIVFGFVGIWLMFFILMWWCKIPWEYYPLLSNTAFAVALLMLLFWLYCCYYTAKCLCSVELGREAKSADYFWTFIGIFIFFIGVWFIQPRVNKLFHPLK